MKNQGFTLIEVAVVMIILGLLMGGIIVPMSEQMRIQRMKQTRTTMEQSLEAITGHALVHGMLPCPDCVDNQDGCKSLSKKHHNDGRQDRNSQGQCLTTVGVVPWVDLGVGAVDSWGNRIHYRVSKRFADASKPGFGRHDTGDITVRDEGEYGLLADQVPLVLVSYGDNGYGAVSRANTTMAIGDDISAEERLNLDHDTIYAHGGDDLVLWMAGPLLKYRMIQAGWPLHGAL
ncbi:MAG: prepilin-type N-terminal cleavage/methylation domain-containing protein [Magnetococcales bacterium]|nr:prepilin-type N-terminal cleavage/methylation domain-containing protein [Magnetococcales bacterium]